MTKIWKKWLARVLVLALLLSLVPGGLTAWATEADTPETTQASVQETQSTSAASAADTVSVTFYTQETTLYETVTVTAGGALGTGMPEEPTQEGYTFLGWYIDGDYQDAKLVTAETAFDADTTVQACWAEDTAAEAETGEAAVGLTSSAGEEETVTAESVKALIDALPSVDELTDMDADAQNEVYEALQAASEAYDALSEEEQEAVDDAALDDLFAYFNAQVTASDEGETITYVASIGETQYTTLAEAISAAKSGDTVTLLKDVELASYLSIDMSVTLDLGGFTITGPTNTYALGVSSDAIVEVKNGTINGYQGVYCSAGNLTLTEVIMTTTERAVACYDSATVTIGSGTTVKSTDYAGVVIWGDGTYGEAGCKSPTLNVYGTVIGGGSFAISGNGTDYSGTTVNIYDGAYVQADEAPAIYNPQPNSTVNVYGGTISGTTGIEMRAGTLNVSGGTISGTADFAASANGNGATTTGVGIAVSQHSTNQPITVNISGGTITGDYAVYETDLQDDQALELISITITDGSLTGDIAAVYIEDSTTDGIIAISGGTYTTDVSEYVIAGNTAITNDGGATYTIGVDATTAVAEVNGVGYTTLQSAIDAAGTTASTVTLLNDTTEDIKIGKEQNITLDLNGKKLTNSADHTITNYGTLTIIDSVGSGTVDNVTHSKGALVNYGTAYLNGGTFTRRAEAGASTTDNGGNSWYTVKNYNQMVVNGATIKNNGKYSSCFANGYQNTTDKTNAQAITGDVTPTLTINSGTVTGGLNSVKNDDCAVLVINGGTFTNYDQSALQNHSTVTINDGSFTGGTYVLYNCGCDEEIDVGVMTINGGTFTADSSTEYILAMVSTASTASVTITGGTFDTNGTSASVFGADSGATEVTNSTVAISGGTFSQAVPEAYCASGYSPTPLLNGTYTVCDHSNVTHVAAKAATCTEAGNAEYSSCNDCGMYLINGVWTDDNSSVIIPATGHSYSTTWSSDADSHWHACTVCNDKTDTARHTFTLVNGVYTCSVCGYVKANDTAKTPAMTVSAGSGSSVYSGKQLKYTISYYNNLNETATVTIVDQLDSGVTFVRASDGGVYDSSTHTVTWTLSAAALTQDSVTVTVKVNDSALTADSGESTPTIYNSAKVTVGSQAAASTNTVSNPVKATSGLASTGDSFPLIALSVVAAVALAALLVLAFLGIRSRKYKGKHE